jgi:hypothetical protein
VLCPRPFPGGRHSQHPGWGGRKKSVKCSLAGLDANSVQLIAQADRPRVYVALLPRAPAPKNDLAGSTLAHYVTEAGCLREERFAVIVIERDGRAIVVTGWRAWVIGAVAVVVTTAVLAARAFLVLGIAVSTVAFLLIVTPAVAILVLMAWFFQPRRG